MNKLACAAAFSGIFLSTFSAIAGTGALENPQPSSFESGIGVISGWHCSAARVDIKFDGQAASQAAYGTSRNDTSAICGKSNTGFALLFNYNNLGTGAHTISALADGVEFAKAAFTVTTLGAEFVTGLSASATVADFPSAGKETTLIWQQSKQGFGISGVAAAGSGSLNGTYQLKRISLSNLASGSILDTQQSNFTATGTMVINGNSLQQTISATINGAASSIQTTGTVTDLGYYMKFTSSSGAVSSMPLLKRGSELTTLWATGSFSEVDFWSRTSTSTDEQAGRLRDAPENSRTSVGPGIAGLLGLQ